MDSLKLKENFVAMSPVEMAVLMDAATKHVKNAKERPVVYQIGLSKELFARLWEVVGKRKADLFINTIFDIGLLTWHGSMVEQIFGGNEKMVQQLVNEASEDIRGDERIH